jgi:DNA primase
VSQNLHLNFDPDAAGMKAAERSILLLLEENVRVRIVELDEGLDPDEYVREHGAEAYRERVKAARTYFYWLADRARARFNMKEPQGRMDAFQFLMPAIQSLSEKLERAAVANDLAGYLGIETGLVLEQFRKTATNRSGQTPPVAPNPARKADRILIPLVLSETLTEDRAERRRFFAALRQVSMNGPAAPIYEVILGMHENDEIINFNTLHERLQAEQQEILAGLVLDPAAAAASVEDGMAAIAALEQEQAEASRKDLLARIKAAEREGRIAEAMELARQMAANRYPRSQAG